MLERRRFRVRGTVQGVGFRPFVYRRAIALGLTGWVSNDSEGVLLEAEGEPSALDALHRALSDEAPPLALVEAVEVHPQAATGDAGFLVAPSRADGHADVAVSADVAPCAACLTELFDPDDRRYGFPFINCTDCGPRFTIVRDIPYDRPSTTMYGFVMCTACQREYDDPADRRFHAQPNACPDCGPTLSWVSADDRAAGSPALAAAIRCLLGGGIVAVKGVGGYHLACDAADEQAVATLRQRKHRTAKPFAVMVGDVATARTLGDLDDEAAAALSSPRRPVLLTPRRDADALAATVAPGLPELGLLLPSSPLHELLLAGVGRPLVMTSGNLSDEPITYDDAHALARLARLADGVLGHDRPIQVCADDSVLRAAPGGRTQLLRRSRGWTPQPLRLPIPTRLPVLAVGAHLKSTVALARGQSVVMSQHLGDLDQWTTYEAFRKAIEHLCHLAGTQPALVAHDLHPDFRSTAWARESGLPLLGVQHHHAHVASCLVEHGRTDRVLGIVYDGVGLGSDGTLWGGEFLAADLAEFERVGHLAPVPLPGGDAAVREPWRMALSWLDSAVGPDAALAWGLTVDPRADAVLGLIRSGRQPQTSSVGRLFDAVAALLGIRSTVSYEGQAAVELEALASRAAGRGPVYSLPATEGALDAGEMLQAMLADIAHQVPVDQVAAGFHRGLAIGTAHLAVDLAAAHGLDTVVLTGGCFQNVLLSDLLSDLLRSAGLQVLVHADLPCNDGAISVGQAAVASAHFAL